MEIVQGENHLGAQNAAYVLVELSKRAENDAHFTEAVIKTLATVAQDKDHKGAKSAAYVLWELSKRVENDARFTETVIKTLARVVQGENHPGAHNALCVLVELSKRAENYARFTEEVITTLVTVAQEEDHPGARCARDAMVSILKVCATNPSNVILQGLTRDTLQSLYNQVKDARDHADSPYRELCWERTMFLISSYGATNTWQAILHNIKEALLEKVIKEGKPATEEEINIFKHQRSRIHAFWSHAETYDRYMQRISDCEAALPHDDHVKILAC